MSWTEVKKVKSTTLKQAVVSTGCKGVIVHGHNMMISLPFERIQSVTNDGANITFVCYDGYEFMMGPNSADFVARVHSTILQAIAEWMRVAKE